MKGRAAGWLRCLLPNLPHLVHDALPDSRRSDEQNVKVWKSNVVPVFEPNPTLERSSDEGNGAPQPEGQRGIGSLCRFEEEVDEIAVGQVERPEGRMAGKRERFKRNE